MYRGFFKRFFDFLLSFIAITCLSPVFLILIIVGAVAMIGLFIALVWRGMVIAQNAPDTFSKLTVVGIISKVALQTVLNIGVVTNSIPNTGISLPFFSYGGSSLVVLMAEMGLILSVSKYSYIDK